MAAWTGNSFKNQIKRVKTQYVQQHVVYTYVRTNKAVGESLACEHGILYALMSPRGTNTHRYIRNDGENTQRQAHGILCKGGYCMA